MPRDGEFIIQINSDELQEKFEDVGDQMISQAKQAVKELAYAAYTNITANAQEKLKKTRADYIRGLKLDELGNDTYLISLHGQQPNAVEDGWDPFDMKPGMLNSQKRVEVGSRAGEPWVQKGKKGQRYAHVPTEHKPFSKVEGNDLAQMLRSFRVKNRKGREQNFTSIFKDEKGAPIEGRAATIKDTDIPGLENVTKYQRIYENKRTGKTSVSSVYLSFKTVSDLSPAEAWQNKGFAGLHAFNDAEEFIEKELDNILKSIGVE